MRRNIFQRVRAPVQRDVPDNKFLRTEQAFEYYMPRLAGNSGKYVPSNLTIRL